MFMSYSGQVTHSIANILVLLITLEMEPNMFSWESFCEFSMYTIHGMPEYHGTTQ